MKNSRHCDLVLHTLAERVSTAATSVLNTPFGVRLLCGSGKFSVGQHVSAPGVDQCSAPTDSEVLAVGTRSDHPGNWYLVRRKHIPDDFALVEEAALRPCAPRHRVARPPLRRSSTESNFLIR